MVLFGLMTSPDAQIEVFPSTALTDIGLLRPVLESAVINPITGEVFTDEIEEDLRSVEQSRDGLNERYYAVARTSGGLVIGVMGLQRPEQEMLAFTNTENPIELINAYVLRSSRGLGAGQALVHHLEDKAKEDGHSELVLNSGPRYQWSGWPFWRSMYGEPVGMLKDHYGPSFDAMVWRAQLDEKK